MSRKLIAAIACRNQGSRLYGKPLQNLDVVAGTTILDNIIQCLQTIPCIDGIVLGISEGIENEIFKKIAEEKNISYITGDENDVLSRLISCGRLANATDIFRVTSESPFLYFEPVETLWNRHMDKHLDATFFDEGIDGTGFEIISLQALELSHTKGDNRHRSELCTLYIREHINDFTVEKILAPTWQNRKDLRLTVDTPEDLADCRNVYNAFKQDAPRLSIEKIVAYLDESPELKQMIAPFTEAGYATMNL
ncbi:MAG: spsF1 [Sediminibacterium sp.]|nr:spsF1 [Sediminibacterium sp.]